MKILQHIILLIFLFFTSWILSFNTYAQSIVLTGSVDDNQSNQQVDSEEKLLFDWSERTQESEEIELKSAEEIDDKDKTIKELEEEKEQLISDKAIVTNNFNAFILNNWALRKYFKQELSVEELQSIENIIITYNSKKAELESLLKNKATELQDTGWVAWELLELKKDLYISFLPFILIDQLWEYKQFIKADFTATKKDTDIQSDIYKKETIVEKKKIIIQEKIDASEQDLEAKKNKVIKSRINEKLVIYSQSERFQTLTIEQRTLVFTTVLEKITLRREKLQSNNDQTLQEKIKLYMLVEQSISDFITNLE